MDTFSELLRYSPSLATAAGVMIIITMIVGVLGNSLTIVALLRHAKLRTVAAAFIASLCISDMMLCFMVLPFAVSQFFHGKWIHGDVLCKMIPLLRYGCVGVSLLSIGSISINRYILIAWPHLYQTIYTKTKVALYVATIWIFSYGLLTPTLFDKWGTFGLDSKLGSCSINHDEHGNTPKIALFVLGFALPCTIIVISYANIYYVVRKSHQKMQQHNSGNKYKRSEMKITKMVLVIFICYVVCYFPVTLAKVFDEDVHHPSWHIVGYLLVYLSSCVNPVVYVTMNKQYRLAYIDTLKCKHNSNLDSQLTQPPPSRNNMSVAYLKNIIPQSPSKA